MINTTDAPTGPVTLVEIERAARDYADRREHLLGHAQVVREHLEAERRKAVPSVTDLTRRCAEAQQRLHNLILRAAHLFEKPRTLILAGVRVGFRVVPGKSTVADDAVGRLRAQLGADAEKYIRKTEEIDLAAAKQLPAALLARCGITVAPSTDAVVITAGPSDLEKYAAALLNDQTGNAAS
jgi:hypothetical protein